MCYWKAFQGKCIKSLENFKVYVYTLVFSVNVYIPRVNQGICIYPENFRVYTHSLIMHIHCNIYIYYYCGARWCRGMFGALQPEGCGFESTSRGIFGALQPEGRGFESTSS